MQNRREFIKNTSFLSLGMLAEKPNMEQFFFNKTKLPLGIQLYTFFNTIDQDLKGNLQKIKGIGYDEVESAFSKKGEYYGLKPKAFASLLQETGLSWRSHHVLGKAFNGMKMSSLQSTPQQLVDELSEVGVKYLVCSYLKLTTLSEVNEGVEILSKAGEIAKKSGITVCYHNHEAEFQKLPDSTKTPFDIFAEQINSDILKFELDLAWVSKAGTDPVQLFKSHPGRFPLLHVKDFDKEFKKLMPVGEGIIDFKKIIKNAKKGGVKHLFVEHDNPANPMESIQSSFKYLKNNIIR